jgi:hypothetical protein
VRRRPIVLALALAIVTAGLLVTLAFGAEPSAAPSALASTAPTAVLESGDLRSEGTGPGLVGNPLLILGAVVALGLGTAVLTLVIARLAQHR